MTIEELDFSIGTYCALKRAGISFKEDLEELSDEELMQIRNINKKRLFEIKNKMEEIRTLTASKVNEN